MTDPAVRELAARIYRLEDRVYSRGPQLAHSSIEGGSLDAHDEDGNLRGRIGLQDDGSYTTTDHNAPPLPAPSPPSLFTFPGGFRVAWDGSYADGSRARADFARVEVHADLTAGFTPTDDTRDATIETPRGAAVNFLTADAVPHYVKLVAVNTSGVDSPASQERSITPLPAGSGGVHTYYGPNPPTDPGTGDLWVDSDNSNIMSRWDGTAWIEVRDAGIQQAITQAGQAQQDAADAIQQAQDATTLAESKITTYYQAAAPSSANAGDLWVDTDTDRLYRWDGAIWVEIQDDGIAAALADAQTAQNTADQKIVSYFQATAPVGAAVGDLWFDTSDGNAQHWWDGDSWSSVPMGTGAIAAGAATTEILADGAATNAKLADEAVDDRVLKSLIALTSRLVAGDPTGARVELNGNGLEAYDANGARTVYLDSSDGSAEFTGTVTGSTVRTSADASRIELNPSGFHQYDSSGAERIGIMVDRFSEVDFSTGLAEQVIPGTLAAAAKTVGGANPRGELYLYPPVFADSFGLVARLSMFSAPVDDSEPELVQFEVGHGRTVVDMADASETLVVAKVVHGQYLGTGIEPTVTDWEQITPVGPASADGLFQILRLATGQAEIQCKVNISGLANGDTIGRIPSWAVPREYVTDTAFTNTGNQSRVNVTAGGEIQLFTEAAPANITQCRFITTYSPDN